jgi:hypothetical protein
LGCEEEEGVGGGFEGVEDQYVVDNWGSVDQSDLKIQIVTNSTRPDATSRRNAIYNTSEGRMCKNVKYVMLVSINQSFTQSYIALTDLRLQIPLDGQILPTIDVLNHQSLFVGQMQQANEPVRGRDVGEHEGAVRVLGQGWDLRLLLLLY